MPSQPPWLGNRAFLLMVLSTIAFWGCGQPPQWGESEAAFKAADALWTAVTSRDEQLLAACDDNLRSLGEAGGLPPESREYLQDVITTARGGDWDTARARLKKMIKAQRRADKKAVKHGS